MRLRRCFASDPAPSSPAARRWRAALRCGARVTHPVSDGPQAARSGRLFGHVGASRPTSRSPGRRPYESQTRRFIKARNLITGVPGHCNVIRAVAPCVYRPSARFRPPPGLRERFLDRRIPGLEGATAGSRRHPSDPVRLWGGAVCHDPATKRAWGEQERRSSGIRNKL